MIKIDPAKYTILVVDDNATNVLLIREIIKRVGYSVLTAASGDEVFDLLHRGAKPDLILLDIMMPEMNGYQVAKQLRQSDDSRDVAIVFLTALTESKDEVRGFMEGGDDYISKPINAGVLCARILYILEQLEYKRIIKSQRVELQEAIGKCNELNSIIANNLHEPLVDLATISNMLLHKIDKLVVGDEVYGLLERASEIADASSTQLENLLNQK